MNKGEGAYTITLVSWILGKPVNGQHLTWDDARRAAVELTTRAHAALGGSALSPATVDNAFEDHQPRVVLGPAYVLDLNADEIRNEFADNGCTCETARWRPCTVCQLETLTDDQLTDAARWAASRHCPLDEEIRATFKDIVAQAYRDAADTPKD